MSWLILIAAVLVVAYLLYLGNRARERRNLQKQVEAEKLEGQVSDHRSMSADHQQKAGELKAEAEKLEEQADREMTKAARHELMADELEPGSEGRRDS